MEVAVPLVVGGLAGFSVATACGAEPRVPQVPPAYVAVSRTSVLEARPDRVADCVSEYCVSVVMLQEPVVLFEVAVPPVFAVEPLTTSAPPVGAAVSARNATVRVTVMPRTSRPVIVVVPGVPAPAVQLYGDEV